MHKNDPDKVGPDKSYIYIYNVMKIIQFSFLYFSISCCFSTWWKNILCSVTKCLRFKKKERYIISYRNYCEWALKVTKIQQEDTFNHYNHLEEVLNYIRAHRHQKRWRVKLWRMGIKFCWKNSVKPCKTSYCNVSLVVNFGRFIRNSLQQKFLFSKVAFRN